MALALSAPRGARAQQGLAQEEPLAATRALWREPDPITLHWQLLALPERVLQLATAPLAALVSFVEERRLDRRIHDLLTNEEKTAIFLPYMKISGSDSVDGGLHFTHSDLFGDDEDLKLSAALQSNLDFKVRASYRQSFAWLNGRRVTARVSYFEDRDARYFPAGQETQEADERAMEQNELQVSLKGELLGPGLLNFRSELTLTYRRTELLRGDREGVPGLGEGAEAVATPPGFGRAIDQPELQLQLSYDTRDSHSRPSGGWLAEADLTVMHDLNGADLSSFRGQANVSLFLQILPRHRVLALSAGGGVATPLQGDHSLPINGHMALGRTAHLRGYKRDRFKDSVAWWASAEYRYPVFESPNLSFAVSSVLFFDVGQAGGSAGELFGEAPRWSAGFGLRGDTPLTSVIHVQLGFSPEGRELIFGLGDVL